MDSGANHTRKIGKAKVPKREILEISPEEILREVIFKRFKRLSEKRRSFGRKIPLTIFEGLKSFKEPLGDTCPSGERKEMNEPKRIPFRGIKVQFW